MSFFTSCAQSCVPVEERQRVNKEKIMGNVMHHQFQINELEREIAALEMRKNVYINARRKTDAFDVVRQIHNIQKKMKQQISLRDLNQKMLDDLEASMSLKETISTITEAQSVFKGMNTQKMYKNFNAASNDMADQNDKMSDINDMLSRNIFEPNKQMDDSDLLAEFALIEDQIAAQAEVPMPAVPTKVPTTASIARLYESI